MAAIREWYGGYSIIYRWFEKKFGEDALYEYWHYIAGEVYSELAKKFSDGGPAFIASYFAEIILEDEGKMVVEADKDSVLWKFWNALITSGRLIMTRGSASPMTITTSPTKLYTATWQKWPAMTFKC
ncbi:hypothetical protein SDC9_194343 [bioreactor metagenome]|uniref:Uncharacterized protein n=1 Tax=bioreactor metagenome TaxID=1076179 RepID=A0A645I601_9ZZZZ